MAQTGRQLILTWLTTEITQASTGDLQRAAQFLAFAREVRRGKGRSRGQGRARQNHAWEAAAPLTWDQERD